MAIFHFDVKTVKRSEGRSAVAAAAYRAGQRLNDARIGQTFNYTKRSGVASTFVALPVDAPALSRNELWNAAEAAETRKNATVAREWLVALPHELSDEQREDLVRSLAAELVVQFDVAVDVAIHEPRKNGGDTNLNFHAHLLTSTRVFGADGFGAKTRILDAAKTGGVEIAKMRAFWADACNDALKAAGSDARIDPRRKAVQAAEAKAFAQEAEDEAERLEAVSGDITSLNTLKASVKAAWSDPGTLITSKSAERAAELRQEAEGHRRQAEVMDTPPERHRGPEAINVKRKRVMEEHKQQARERQRELEAARLAEQRIAEKRAELAAERAAVLAAEKAAEIEAARQAELEEAKRPEAIKAFTKKQLERVDEYFPTPAKKWRFRGFVVMKPDSLQTSFRSQHRFRMRDDEVQDLQKSMLRRWVERIVEDLSALKPARNIWMALTGGSPEAGNSLKDGLEAYPEFGDQLHPVIEQHEADNAPKPVPKAPKINNEPGPSGGGLSM